MWTSSHKPAHSPTFSLSEQTTALHPGVVRYSSLFRIHFSCPVDSTYLKISTTITFVQALIASFLHQLNKLPTGIPSSMLAAFCFIFCIKLIILKQKHNHSVLKVLPPSFFEVEVPGTLRSGTACFSGLCFPTRTLRSVKPNCFQLSGCAALSPSIPSHDLCLEHLLPLSC